MVTRPGARKDETEEMHDGDSEMLARVDRVRESYRNHFPDTRPGAVEMNQRMLSTSAARLAAYYRMLESNGFKRSTGSHALLRCLYFADGHCLAQNELSRELDVSSANITHLVDRLEKRGLVTRLMDPRDRRMSYVQLTTEGNDFCYQVVPIVANFNSEIGECFSDSELVVFNEYLARLQKYAEHLYPPQAAPVAARRGKTQAQARP